MKKKVSIIGLGYVGLPSFVAVHKTQQYDVVGYTRSKERVASIRNGHSLIDEPYVDEYLHQYKNDIHITNDPSQLSKTDFFLICVPTPVREDHTPDYTPVIEATTLIAPYIKKGSHIILESTVNPGTCEEIIIPLLQTLTKLKPGKEYNIAHCPERINPGDSQWNIYNISRNVGSLTKRDNKIVAQFYRSFITHAEVHEVSSLKIAEASKIVENTFRDINIAYVNELAQSFDAMGIDLIETIHAASNKPFSFIPHWPGCGVGGHCIAVDPYYLIRRASVVGFDHRFLKTARDVNESMPEYTVARLVRALNEVGLPVKKTKIALLGLSYKQNIGDMRESPALIIKSKLEKLGATLVTWDPFVKKHEKKLSHVIKDVKAIVIATSHREIKQTLVDLLLKSKAQVIIDGRNCIDGKAVKKMGIIYKGIGR